MHFTSMALDLSCGHGLHYFEENIWYAVIHKAPYTRIKYCMNTKGNVKY